MEKGWTVRLVNHLNPDLKKIHSDLWGTAHVKVTTRTDRSSPRGSIVSLPAASLVNSEVWQSNDKFGGDRNMGLRR